MPIDISRLERGLRLVNLAKTSLQHDPDKAPGDPDLLIMLSGFEASAKEYQ